MNVPNSVIEAIQLGIWDFEPEDCENEEYDSTHALPGSEEKLSILARRLSEGQPLWHPSDRRSYVDHDDED